MAKDVGENAKELPLLTTDNSLFLAELHWYEAKGIGKKELKIKSLLEKIQ